MKRLFKLGVAFFTFALGLFVVLMWVSLSSYINPQIATYINPIQINEDSRQAEKQDSESEDTACLNADTPKPKFIVSFGVINSKAVGIPKPEYPEAAKIARISGEVQAAVIVGEKGNVIWARVKAGHPLLQAAVKKVVCQAHFKPIKLSGKPVAVNGFIVYKFMLPY